MSTVLLHFNLSRTLNAGLTIVEYFYTVVLAHELSTPPTTAGNICSKDVSIIELSLYGIILLV